MSLPANKTLLEVERLLRGSAQPSRVGSQEDSVSKEDLVPPPGLVPPPEDGPGKPLRVGALAAATGRTVRALHLYEELSLLEPARSGGGYRLYGPGSITRVAWISNMQDLGFSLPEIRDLLAEWKRSRSAPSAMQKLTALYREKLAAMREQVARLRKLDAELEASLHYLETCESCEPVREVSACSHCDRHECGDHAPVLVAGLTSN